MSAADEPDCIPGLRMAADTMQLYREPQYQSCILRAVDTLRVQQAETAKLRALLVRVVKYVREDRARTPGVTRLARLTEEIEDVLAALAETEGAT